MMTAIILFAVGAVFGLHILMHVLKNKPTPKASVALHGLLVAIALVMVIVAAAGGNSSGKLITSLVFFIAAALGGFVMAYFDFGKNQLPPKALALLHPVLAVIGLIILIMYAVQP